MKIGILKPGITPDDLRSIFPDYDEMFVQLLDGHGFEFTTYTVKEDEFPQSVEQHDAYIISGSAHGVYEDFPWITRLLNFIQEIDKQQIPMLGVCFGHQAIAKALGGSVEKFSGGFSVGVCSYQLDGVDEPLNIAAWHQDQVMTLPANAEKVGRSDFCENAVLRYGKRILTMQFHPEFSKAYITALLDYRKGDFSDDFVRDATASIETLSISRNRITDIMVKFLKQFNG